MPTYEYECEKCGHRFELFQSMKDEPRKRCPKCRGKVRRLLGTGAGMIFKGSGFYATDYRSDSYQKEKKSDSGPAAPAAGASGDGGSAPETGKKPEPKTPPAGAPPAKPAPAPAKRKRRTT